MKLGEPGTLLAETVEEPVVKIETGPASMVFQDAALLVNRFTVNHAANDGVTTAELQIGLADHLEIIEGASGIPELRDWLIRGTGLQAHRPEVHLLGGKRIQITTSRGEPGDDWPIFEGFAERLELGFSGASKTRPRWLTLHITGTIVAADREPSQQMWGQWRRNYRSHHNLLTGEEEGGTLACVRVGIPLIFNPGGRPNCHPEPLGFAGGEVFIFTDADDPAAIPWTIAKALRYIQWAAYQPAPPVPQPGAPGKNNRYDQEYQSLEDSDFEAGTWTTFDLRHANLTDLLFADLGGVTVLEAPPEEGVGALGLKVLLRALPDGACQGMSVLECFAYLCDRAHMLMDSYQAYGSGFGTTASRTYLRFHVPGHTRDVGDILGGVSPSGRPIVSGGGMPLDGALSRRVWLRIPADNSTYSGATAAELLAAGQCVEGNLVLDDTSRRLTVHVGGSPTLHEMTVELRPGWLPNEMWDVDPDDDDAVQAAITAADESGGTWEDLFLAGEGTPTKFALAHVGHYWVLNEGGAFTNTDPTHERSHGPWAGEEKWKPYNFATEADIADLARRHAEGWSCRRRRFLPGRATNAATEADLDKAVPIPVLVEISFNAGVKWWHSLYQYDLEADRCAITIAGGDLRLITDPDGTENFVTAYIKGLLRIRVTAQIEGDDALYGYAHPNPLGDTLLAWEEFVDRAGQLERMLRDADSSYLARAASAAGYGLAWPASLDDVAEADALASRLQDELQARRVSGQITIPYLLEPSDDDPWETYHVGDELAGVQTGDGETSLDFQSWRLAGLAGPRIVGVKYTWSKDPAEMSTLLTISDDALGADDLVAPPMQEDGYA